MGCNSPTIVGSDYAMKDVVDAKARGARVVEINPAKGDFAGSRKMPMTVVLNVNDEMLVMQEELFAPVLCVKPYKEMSEVVAYINSGERFNPPALSTTPNPQRNHQTTRRTRQPDARHVPQRLAGHHRRRVRQVRRVYLEFLPPATTHTFIRIWQYICPGKFLVFL
jgi:hypothetical protein